MISLGKIQNPATGDVERDLDQASIFIVSLEMLKSKRRHETPADLLRLMDSAVLDLQLNFLDEQKKGAAKPETAADPQEDAGDAATAADEATQGGAES